MADLEIRAFKRRLLVVFDKQKEPLQQEYNTGGSFIPADGEMDGELIFGFGGENGRARRVSQAG